MAAKAATTTIPIVFVVGFDPVKLGLVASLNRPGGNLTGVSLLNAELAPKRAAIAARVVPVGHRHWFSLQSRPIPMPRPCRNDTQAAARKLGLTLHTLLASTERDFDAAFATLVQLRVGALVIGTDGFFVGRSQHLGALTLRHAVPAIFQNCEFVAAGGLMSYSGSETDANRLMGAYTGRILKGEKPADLPVQQSTKVALSINLKTAKALGVTVPLIMQMTADEVIE